MPNEPSEKRLIDEYAQAALTGYITKYGCSADQNDHIAEWCWNMAQEMMRQRDKLSYNVSLSKGF